MPVKMTGAQFKAFWDAEWGPDAMIEEEEITFDGEAFDTCDSGLETIPDSSVVVMTGGVITPDQRAPRQQEIDAERFYLDTQRTVLEPGEILSEIVVPEPPPNARFGYVKFKLCESSWPIATACCVLGVGDDGAVASVRLGLGGVGTTPYVVDVSGLVGGPVTPDAAAEVARVAEQAVSSPYEDALASGAYRKQIAGAIAKRALLAAAA